MLVTGPVRTLDVAHTPIAWAGATAWGLIVFWGVRRLHRPRMRWLGLLAGVAVAVPALGAALGIGPSRAASLLGLRSETVILLLATLMLVAGAAALLSTRTSIRSTAMSVLVVAVVALFILFDLGVLKRGDALRDLRLYLAAGQRFAEGLEPYRLSPLPSLLADQSAYPFLYPPVSLPLFAVLAALPFAATSVIWIVLSVAGGIHALHLLGVRGAWFVVLALWPPFFEGLWAGNVAVPALALLAAGFTFGRLLVLGPLLKVQGAIPPIWLLRERRWRELTVGIAITAGICLFTLPLVGPEAWFHWIAGLRAFQGTQHDFPALYVFALPRVVPYGVFLAAAAAAVGWAVLRGGTPGLARLGLASVVASPSLYRHGILAGLPAILALEPQLVWLVLGLPLTYWGMWIAVFVTALAGTIRRREASRRHDGHPAPWTPARERATAVSTTMTDAERVMRRPGHRPTNPETEP